MIEATISAAAGGACAGGAVLLYCAEKLPGIKKATDKLHTDRAQSLLILTAASAMVATPVGQWWNELVNQANTWLQDFIGSWTGLLITGVPALVALMYFANDLITRKVETRTRVLAAVLPVLAVTIPGAIGQGVRSLLGFVITLIGRLVAGAFGIS